MALPKLNDYALLEKIGTGSYATVYKAVKKDSSRDVVAIKCVDSSTLSKSAIDNLITEINLLKVLKHEHIVEMKDFFWGEGQIYIVMEYCNAGDLSTFIKRKNKLPENVCRKFLQQLALALKYLRSNNVCHMDLKPQNLLLIRKPTLRLKVGDFGFAQYLSCDEHKFSIRGSPLYMAPEILLHHEYDARVDLWSVGVIMYECLFGKAPYSSNTLEELAEKIKSCRPIEIPKGSHVSNECNDLLQSLLKHDPAERITFENFFAHEFLDLEHAPTQENYEKAIALIQCAIKEDTEKNYQEAFQLYCNALRYFVPILMDESDSQKKRHLRQRINEYINRAEKLKQLCGDKSTSNEANHQLLKEHKQLLIRQQSTNSFPYAELKSLSKSTSDMASGLEMGEVGEQYFAEGNYTLALEKFKSCLGILVRVLSKEPPGRRRELLHQQIQMWMKQAECTKGLLATKGVQDLTKSAETTDQCRLS
ncbi:serine/threonine-protein kinase ULK3 [Microplitis demolitor]|uniref:serine/threonine-protein kinase ULK3 n=1 Tax=Microplitis demolitor TaxID=69319 RepID=UPI0004CD90E8|nr:serine/threonine-protein kinase ULK3 [Microplitis demolitor]XP_008552814.1 serine/threonine-protein kinase ULK3 [Microplitis demolitor]XP_053597145.1 serine/threonine-protein kinase ULK3 [Microplitis demolitor]